MLVSKVQIKPQGKSQMSSDTSKRRPTIRDVAKHAGVNASTVAVACATLLDNHPDVSVAANDLIALGCYDTLNQRGLRCPENISIVGHNDMPLLDMLNPPLTTLRIQDVEMDRQAARLLLGHIHDPGTPPLRITLTTRLSVRGSTAAPQHISTT
jgi:LacI family transcriptional regulator